MESIVEVATSRAVWRVGVAGNKKKTPALSPKSLDSAMESYFPILMGT